MSTTRRHIITNPQLQQQVLSLVAAGDMEAVPHDNGTAYRLTPQGIAHSKPVVITTYTLTDKGRKAIAKMKRWY